MYLNYVDNSTHGKPNLYKKNWTDAGYDICSNENVTILPGDSYLVSTALFIEFPPKYVAILKSRSGLSVNYDIEVGAGVIDSDYRGEVKVHLYNHGKGEFVVNKGDRIAQLILMPIEVVAPKKVTRLSNTNRSDNGFGSSGV